MTHKIIASFLLVTLLAVLVDGAAIKVKVGDIIVLPNHGGSLLVKSGGGGTTTTTQPPGLQYSVFEPLTQTASNVPRIVTTDSEYSSGYAAWLNFDHNAATRWTTADGSSYPHWVKYDCGAGQSNVWLTTSFDPWIDDGLKTLTIDGSQDDAIWTTGSVHVLPNSWCIITNADTPQYYRYLRISASNGYLATYAVVWSICPSSSDFENPKMTSTNTPAGYIVAADEIWSAAYDSYLAFNKRGKDDPLLWWNTLTENYPHWIAFKFPTNTVINGFTIQQYQPYGMSNIDFQASADFTNWTTLSTHVAYDTPGILVFTNNNAAGYVWYRWYSTNGCSGPIWNAGVWEIVAKHYR